MSKIIVLLKLFLLRKISNKFLYFNGDKDDLLFENFLMLWEKK